MRKVFAFLLLVEAIAGLPASAGNLAADQPPVLASVVVGKPVRLEVYPPRATLASSRQRVQFVVSGHYADGSIQDLTRIARVESSHPKIVRAHEQTLVPVGDGVATITVRAGDQQAQIAVVVSNQGKADPVSFRHDVVPALTHQGCNSGACHGSPSGKGGFSLSMMGYDPDTDLLTLSRADRNRRINLLEPEKSLLIRKPTLQVSHGGGEKLHRGDVACDVLTCWIEEGCRADPADKPRFKSVEVYPMAPRVVRRPAHTQQLNVLARFSDGGVRDVTSLATYTTSDPKIAVVTPAGLVVGKGRGTAAVSVRYLAEVVSRSFTFVENVEGFVWNNPPVNNCVDQLVHEQLRLLNYLPSATCSDEEFIRRIHLDVIGLLPTIEETRTFLADRDAKKRSKTIDALLARPEHARFWAQKTADLLRVNEKLLSKEGAKRYGDWIVKAFAENMPYDRFVTALLTADGDTVKNPPASYYRAAANTETVAETTAQLFLGVRIGCAKCHNHPFERWTQDNYHGIAAVFHRVRRQGSKKGAMTISVRKSGEWSQPRTGREMKPWLPLVGDATVGPNEDRREVFARWLVRPDNPFFARVEVNRMWAHLMGRGIVDPVDDFRDSNPPANPALLDALAKEFVEKGFDRKHILRTILNSRTYQQTTQRNAFNRMDDKHFSSASVRLLAAEQILDAVCRVAEIPEPFPGVRAGTFATQTSAPAGSDFLRSFGQPARETPCQCERPTEPTLEQALQMLNGPTVQQKVQAANNRLRRVVKAGQSNFEIVQELYLAALCREPRAIEKERIAKYLDGKSDRMKALEDVLWAILNTREFLFQH